MLSNHAMYVGVDLHQSVIQLCVLNAAGEVVEESRHTGRSLDEGLQVVKYLERWRSVARVGVEAVGMNRWFVNACRSSGLEVVVVDQVKLNLRRLGRKTDRRDAYEIARRLRLGDVHRNAVTYYPSEEEYGFRKLLRTRHALVRMRQQLINQIRALLRAYRIEAAGNSLYGPRNLKRLAALQMPNGLLAQCHAANVASLETVQASINTLTREIEKQSQSSCLSALRRELPGVGAQTAATLFYELGDVHRFRNAKAVASYVGLVPRVSNSGDRRNHGRLTKRGNSELRWILNELAVRLLTRDDRAKQWAAPKLHRMHKNKVRIALARRLLVGIYHMLRDGEVFSLERCLSMRTA